MLVVILQYFLCCRANPMVFLFPSLQLIYDLVCKKYTFYSIMAILKRVENLGFHYGQYHHLERNFVIARPREPVTALCLIALSPNSMAIYACFQSYDDSHAVLGRKHDCKTKQNHLDKQTFGFFMIQKREQKAVFD